MLVLCAKIWRHLSSYRIPFGCAAVLCLPFDHGARIRCTRRGHIIVRLLQKTPPHTHDSRLGRQRKTIQKPKTHTNISRSRCLLSTTKALAGKFYPFACRFEIFSSRLHHGMLAYKALITCMVYNVWSIVNATVVLAMWKESTVGRRCCSEQLELDDEDERIRMPRIPSLCAKHWYVFKNRVNNIYIILHIWMPLSKVSFNTACGIAAELFAWASITLLR